MGVAGLQGYIEKYCHGAFTSVDIAAWVHTYMEETGQDPVLVIDGASCLNHMYKKAKIDFISGGQLKEYAFFFIQALTHLNELGIEILFFSDGSPPEHRLDLWVRRRDEEAKKISIIFKLLEKGRVDIACEKAAELRPKSSWKYLAEQLKVNRIKLIQTIEEADDAILEYIAKNGCFAVLAQDSDFVIAEDVANYFSVEHLNVETMTTKAYKKEALARKLRIHQKLLPLLATFLGNDIVKTDNLRNFHNELLRDDPNIVILRELPFLPRGKLIPKLASWLERQLANYINRGDEYIIDKAAQLANCLHMIELIKKSVHSYSLRTEFNSDEESTCGNQWDEILRIGNNYFKDGSFDNEIQSILTRRKLFSGSSIEYYDNPNLPPCGVFLARLRRRLYGVLLNELPSERGDRSVKEYVFLGEGTLNDPPNVQAELPDQHPGLLTLWEDKNCPLDAKWRLLCWAVSNDVKIKEVCSLTGPLQVPALALFYLKNEAKSIMATWEIAAFLAHAVRLITATIDDIKSIDCIASDPKAVHLSSLYQGACNLIYSIAKACGSPTSLQMYPNYVYYDGKVFHSTYMAMKNGADGETFCGKRPEDIANFKKVMKFLRI